MACQQGTLTLPDTWSVKFLTCICSTCWDQSFSRTCRYFFRICSSNILRYFLDFAYFSTEILIFIRPTCRDVLWYGAGVCPSVCLSVRPPVHKACKHDTDWTVWARTVKLGTLTTYDKRINPIDFQGQGSKVKVTRYILMLKLVNTIQTEPFQLGPSNLLHILLLIRRRHLLIFKVRGQRSRSHTKYCFLAL